MCYRHLVCSNFLLLFSTCVHNAFLQLTKMYMTSRLESVETVIADNLDNPLDDQTMVSQQLEQMATIGRCEYSKTCQVLITLFDQTASSYQELLASSSSAPSQQMTLREGASHSLQLL